jgi:hypothetical protein
VSALRPAAAAAAQELAERRASLQACTAKRQAHGVESAALAEALRTHEGGHAAAPPS